MYYVCEGKDKNGSWQIQKRYSEFEMLRNVLKQKWYGLPIPILPQKHKIKDKLAKKKDLKKFFIERQYFLNRFLKILAGYEFIIESFEFQVFSRNLKPTKIPDIKKYQNLLIEYHKYIQFSDDDFIEVEIYTYLKEIRDFTVECRHPLKHIKDVLLPAIRK